LGGERAKPALKGQLDYLAVREQWQQKWLDIREHLGAAEVEQNNAGKPGGRHARSPLQPGNGATRINLSQAVANPHL
jgi:hypothetical protein